MQQRGIPWVLHAASLAQWLPVIAAARYGTKLPTPRRWIVVWCLALLATDAAQLYFRVPGGNNLWIQYFAVPLHNAVMLWALSLWQRDPVWRLAFRMAIPLVALTVLALIPAVQSQTWFYQVTYPFQALVLLAGSLFTLVSLAIREPERVTSNDWFWVTLGASLYFALRVALPPFVQLTLSTNRDLARLAYVVSAWTDIVAYLLIARGMVCPLPQARSGGFS